MDKNFKIFVIVAIVFLGIAIAGSTFMVLKMVQNNKGAVEKTSSEATSEALKPIALGDAISTNIFDENGEQHIARVEIGFGVDESSKEFKELEEKIKEKNLIIRDEIIHIIKEQTYEMMSKSDVQAKLSDEITPRINELLGTDLIKQVYFGDIFVQ